MKEDILQQRFIETKWMSRKSYLEGQAHHQETKGELKEDVEIATQSQLVETFIFVGFVLEATNADMITRYPILNSP